MNVDTLVIHPRLREQWEAVDLGFVLARSWWAELAGLWLLSSLPVLVILAASFSSYPWVAITVVWWLKPFFDACLLMVVSRKLFNENLGRRQAVVGMFRAMGKECLPWLLWRRLMPTRSLDLPVTLLEKLRGAGRASRIQLLHRRSASPAFWLTMVCVHVEMFLYLGFFAFVSLMIPEQADISVWSQLLSDSTTVVLLLSLLSYVAMVLVAPFYVCAGFMLYINRRIELEAWDIEIVFRRLSSRLSQRLSQRLPQRLPREREASV